MTFRRKHLVRSVLLALALAPFSWAGAASLPAATSAQAPARHTVREIEIVVDGAYRPSRVEVSEGEHVRLVFVRRDYGPCTREVIFPALGIRRELPAGTRVVIDLGMLATGEYEFECGMRMIRGTVVVRGRT